MNFRIAASQLFVLAGIVALIVLVSLVWRRKVPEGRGGLLDALRLVTSQAAYFVPVAMTTTLVTVAAFALNRVPNNPWLTSDYGTGSQILFLLLISAGVAGQIGLLEGHRDGVPRPGPDEFVRGVRDHLLTIAAGNAAVMLVASWLLPEFGGGLYGASPVAYVILCAPFFAIAPLAGAASRHPGRPVAALAESVAIALRRPWPTLRVFAVQACVVTVATGIVAGSGRYFPWGAESGWNSFTHGTPLGFHLYPLAELCRHSDLARFVTIGAGLTSPVFVTAYWMISNKARVPEAQAETA